MNLFFNFIFELNNIMYSEKHSLSTGSRIPETRQNFLSMLQSTHSQRIQIMMEK